MNQQNRKQRRARRHRRVRRKVHGTAGRPRMAISMSSRRMVVQFIDDDAGKTILSASTRKDEGGLNCETAGRLGDRLARLVEEKRVADWVVDRGGHKFHGRLQAVVNGLRKARGDEDSGEAERTAERE